MGGAAKSVKRGLGTRRAITAASFADSCHSDERKQVTQQVEVKNSPNESIQASRESLVFSLDYVSLRSDHPLCQGKGQLLPHCGSWTEHSLDLPSRPAVCVLSRLVLSDCLQSHGL